MYHKPGSSHIAKIMQKFGGKKVAAPVISDMKTPVVSGITPDGVKDSGTADGAKTHKRLDKSPRKLANGGSAKKAGTKINVIVAPQGKEAVPVSKPIPVPVQTSLNAPTSAPMPMAPAGNAPIPNQMASLPTTPTAERDFKKGGACYKKGGAVKMTAGAASGEGRLEKAEIQKDKR